MNLQEFADQYLHENVKFIDEAMTRRINETTDDMRYSTWPCLKCGDGAQGGYNLHYSRPMRDVLIIAGMCFTCNHWREIKEAFVDGFDRNGKRQVIVNNMHYTYDAINPIVDTTLGGFFGHGGRKFKIKFPNRDIFVETNNLWCQGVISSHWHSDFPDNAIFV